MVLDQSRERPNEITLSHRGRRRALFYSQLPVAS